MRNNSKIKKATRSVLASVKNFDSSARFKMAHPARKRPIVSSRE
jgi:hypothetical protein